MTSQFAKARRRTLICSAAIAAVLAATPALAQEQLANIDIAAQPMDAALKELAKQSGANLLFSPDAVRGLRARSLQTTATPEDAARMLLAGTDLFVKKDATGSLLVDRADPQSGSAAGDGADAGTVAALVVTAQKKEENIQDVPIAISAFTEKSLQEQKIEGGFDLLKAIPNVTFSKNNFSSYNFSIRGIGTKAVSVATDPGVAVAFNGSTLVRNRLFEQEYLDVERVEVLRGPQGTLYGRNATAGVINVISATPKFGEFEGWLKGEVGNYNARRMSAMVNIPLASDTFALRLAAAETRRDGYDYNDTTHHAINGRNLWTARLTIGLQPSESVKANFIWERFNEDDNRSRTGKQLCHRDPGVSDLMGISLGSSDAAHLSQGCKPGSLYDPNAFGTPNGLSIPFMLIGQDSTFLLISSDAWVPPIQEGVDPYGGMMQSNDLRHINSIRDPKYRAATNVYELNLQVDLPRGLDLTSQTAYVRDKIYSFQDYNRFNTNPVFNDSSLYPMWYSDLPNPLVDLTRGGVFCDPQIGCSDTIAGFDISRARSSQFYQELRLQSQFGGAINFNIGANYTRYKTEEDYFVFYNLISLIAQSAGGITLFNASADPTKCSPRPLYGFPNVGQQLPVPIGSPGTEGCVYIDPNPIESINGEGHNYFRSKNPYRLSSAAAFGELYWQITPDLKVTGGLRYTSDKKIFIPVPSQVLLSSSVYLSGTVDRGYPEKSAIKQQWGEVTGRLGIDWKPELTFTDKSMVYAFYSRGYKGGGANPPGIGYRDYTLNIDYFGTPMTLPPFTQTLPYPAIFKPEFVNAYELGAKNALLGGALTLDGDAFFYDYRDYQVSQIKERTAVNENFDAKVWGLELESSFTPSPNLTMRFTLGYQDSRIANGEKSIDLMNRTQGDPNLVVVKPFVIMTSNCVASKQALHDWVNDSIITYGTPVVGLAQACGGFGLGYPAPLNPLNGPNGGAGVYADLGGKQLPNAPHWTTSLGAQYGTDIGDGWRATIRADGYWQSQSWARVYNAVNDKLHGWYNANLSLWVENDNGLKIELYAKNILDKTPITDAFLNSDDTALTTNVFVLDPRLIGLSIKKGF
ncbi:MAG: TonB-dependent receptor domain-containing protein [Parcubacteria group bacterium]